MFSVYVLLYGNFPELAERCLTSIVKSLPHYYPGLIKNICIGGNAISQEVYDLTCKIVEPVAKRIKVYFVSGSIDGKPANVGKYPLMRQMFKIGAERDSNVEKQSKLTMWFDDDSFITDLSGGWWEKVQKAVSAYPTCVLGSQYKISLNRNQIEAIKNQSWCSPSISTPARISFCTGGWWTTQQKFLAYYGYPWPELYHNGGDVMLGALCLHRRVPLIHFRDGIAINADADAQESKAERRGLSTRPLWSDFDPSKGVNLDHHKFVTNRVDFNLVREIKNENNADLG